VALSPLINAAISRQDTVIEVIRKGDGSQPHDEVYVSTSLTLAADLDTQEVKLLLPLSSSAGSTPLMRYVEDAVTEAAPFDPVERSVYDQAVADALAGLQEEQRDRQAKLAKAIDKAAQGFSQAVLTVKPGQRDLRFFYTVAATRAEASRQFQLQVLAPLASFILQPGGSIGVAALLPRGATLVEAVALQDPTNPGSALPNMQQTELGGRTCLGWLWQNDPMFRIRYGY
jgi:hypothetical protein